VKRGAKAALSGKAPIWDELKGSSQGSLPTNNFFQKNSDEILDFAVAVCAQPADGRNRCPNRELYLDLAGHRLWSVRCCPATRFLVVGEGVQAISEPLSAGQGAVLAFVECEHELQVSAIDCDAEMTSLRLVTMNQSSPGHGGGVDLLTDGTVVAKN
jgi:hypothetical protein